jgi:peptide/nickel transport system substrate-binding protein
MELWLTDLPVIPVTQARKLIPFDTTYWTNWPTAENNYLHATTWWQSTHKIIHSLERATR